MKTISLFLLLFLPFMASSQSFAYDGYWYAESSTVLANKKLEYTLVRDSTGYVFREQHCYAVCNLQTDKSYSFSQSCTPKQVNGLVQSGYGTYSEGTWQVVNNELVFTSKVGTKTYTTKYVIKKISDQKIIITPL